MKKPENSNYQMKLPERPFYKIKSGEKRIEARLFDKKRQNLKIGDIIAFFKLPDLDENISVKVIELLQYDTFQELINDIPMELFGYPNNSNKLTFAQSYYRIYTKEDEKKYGVIGIQFTLLSQ